MKRPIASTLSAVCVLTASTGVTYAYPGGKHQKTVYVQSVPAQAPTTYVAQAPPVYTIVPQAAQAPTFVAQAPAAYTYAPQATQAAQAPSAVGNAPGDDDYVPEPDERRDFIEELRGVKADAVKDKSTLSERRTAVRDRASELVVDASGKDADDPGVKKLVRSLVSEVMSGNAPANGRTFAQTGYTQGQAYCPTPGYPVAPAYSPSFAPAPFVLIPIGPVYFAPPPPPRHCIHGLLRCLHCR